MQFSGVCIIVSEYYCSDSCRQRGLYRFRINFLSRIKSANQLTRRTREHQYKRPEVLKAVAPNQVWIWDISYIPSWVKGQHFYLYMIVDIYSRKIIAAEVFTKESGQYAAELLQRAVWNEKCSSRNLVLHSDNGGPMRSCTLLAKMYALGVLSSYSRPLVSNDNPYSESLFRTIKYCPWWPENGFRTIDEARSWLSRFTRWYNLEHKPAVLSMLLRMNAIAELMHKYWKPEKSLSRSSQTSS